MAAHLKLTVDIDADAVVNLIGHAMLAAEEEVMPWDETCCWVRAELERFICVRA